METGPVYIKSLAIRVIEGGQARVEAKLENHGDAPTPPLLLLLYFYDEENRVRDRISIRLKPFNQGDGLAVNTVFRLKSPGYFSYTARLEKIV